MTKLIEKNFTKQNFTSFSLQLLSKSFIGFENIVQLLIDRGAYLNEVDDDNFSALLHAANNGELSNEYL